MNSFLEALRVPSTYDLRHNHYLWFGIAWGLPVPIFSIALDLAFLGTSGRSFPRILLEHPIHFFALAHPLLFGIVFGALGTIRKNLERENAELVSRLRNLATTDPLTGLHNRRYADDEFPIMLTRSRRARRPLAVTLFDIDGFKTINDRLGHQEGDRVLRAIADSLRSVARQGDLLARYGGDEFLLVSENDLAGALRLMERMQESVARRTGYSVSGGVALWPEDGDAPDSLFKAADARLGERKRILHHR